MSAMGLLIGILLHILAIFLEFHVAETGLERAGSTSMRLPTASNLRPVSNSKRSGKHLLRPCLSQ